MGKETEKQPSSQFLEPARFERSFKWRHLRLGIVLIVLVTCLSIPRTSFVGACKNLQAIEGICHDPVINKYLMAKNYPPHAYHMGEAWERMIGVPHKIMDSMSIKTPTPTHEVLTILMKIIAAIINALPVVPDPSVPKYPVVPAPAVPEFPAPAVPEYPVDPGSFVPEKFWVPVFLFQKFLWFQFLPQEEDLVLLRDKDAYQNSWPMGLVHWATPSFDGLVCQVEAQIVKPRESDRDSKTLAPD